MRSAFSRPQFVLGPVKPSAAALTAWLQLSVTSHLQQHARPEVVWMAMPGGADSDLPDLMFVIPGRQACFMSFTSPDQPLDPARAALQQRLQAAGAGCALICDEEGALRALKAWEVLMPAACGPSGLAAEPASELPQGRTGEAAAAPDGTAELRDMAASCPADSRRLRSVPVRLATGDGARAGLLAVAAMAAQFAGSPDPATRSEM